MAPTVLVTRLEYGKAQPVFDGAEATHHLHCLPAPSDERDLAKAARRHEASAVILGVERYQGELYAALPEGGVIARFGVGHDGVDKTKATAAGLLATNTPGVLTNAVAEHTIWLLGALARGIAAMDAGVRAGTWRPHVGSEMRGKRLAVLGCGQIGGRVAAIASQGLGLRVVGFDCLPREKLPALDGVTLERYTTSLEEAIAEADVVSVHLPAVAETRHLCDAGFFAAMRRGACFINTARGSLVDERALFEALAGGHLAGAALDVFEHEPYEPVDPAVDLRTLDNVLLTSHAASSSVEACRQMAERALANVLAGLQRRFDDMDLLNPDVLPRLQP